MFSKLIVATVVLINVLFAFSVLFVFSKTGNEPVTLITAWFTFTTGELWLLSKIKREVKK